MLIKKRALSQQESVRVHEETWAGGNESLRLTISQAREIQPRCAASVVFPLRTSLFTSELPWPGSKIRRMVGWTQVEKNREVGALVSGCPTETGTFSCSLRCSRLGKERIVPHSVVRPIHFLVLVFICVWTWHSYRATYWCAVFATAYQDVVGYRTPDEALVC